VSSSAEFEIKSQRQEKYQRFVDNQIFQHEVGGGPILVVQTTENSDDSKIKRPGNRKNSVRGMHFADTGVAVE